MRLASLLALAAFPLLTMCSSRSSAPPQVLSGQTPDSFRVAFETTHGRFVVQVMRNWAPVGVERFRNLLEAGFFDDQRFFRVVPGFIAQFGLAADPKDDLPWDAKPIADDPVRHTNELGTLTFATKGPGTRSHQLFFNVGNNPQLDSLGFAPIGKVIEGIDVVNAIYPGDGERPSQQLIQTLGNEYLDRMFPKLERIKTVRILPP